MVALIEGCELNSPWKIVPPSVLDHPGAKFSPTSFMPWLLVAPAATVLADWLQTILLYPLANEIAFGSVSSPPLSTNTCGLVTPHEVTHDRKPLPINSPTASLSKLT